MVTTPIVISDNEGFNISQKDSSPSFNVLSFSKNPTEAVSEYNTIQASKVKPITDPKAIEQIKQNAKWADDYAKNNPVPEIMVENQKLQRKTNQMLAFGGVVSPPSLEPKLPDDIPREEREQTKQIREGAQRQSKNIGAGLAGDVEAVGGLVQYIGDNLRINGKQVSSLQEGGKELTKIAKKYRENLSAQDPNILDEMTQGAGSSLPFLVLGATVAGGSTLIGLSPKISAVLGTGVNATSEALIEAGSVYNRLKEKGYSEVDAGKGFAKTFWANLPVNYVLDKWIFAKTIVGKELKQILSGVAQEDAQEVLQQVISNWASKDETTIKDLIHTAIVTTPYAGFVGAGKIVIDKQISNETGELTKAILDKKNITSQEEAETVFTAVKGMSELQKIDMIDKMKTQSTEEQVALHDESFKTFTQNLKDSGLKQDEIDSTVVLHKAVIARIAEDLGKGIGDVALEALPTVGRVESMQGDVLNQEDITNPEEMSNETNVPETGKRFSAYVIKNKEAGAKNLNDDQKKRYGVNIEPKGTWMQVSSKRGQENAYDDFYKGTIEFKNPLVVEYKDTSETGWKKDLSDMYGGKTGQSLTNAIKKDGYDGIVTYSKDSGIISEIVALNVGKLYQEDKTEAFKKWFGDSKVVDENGEPLVVYHGTNEFFTDFDKSMSGKTTGAKSASKGMFFTDSIKVAESYATYASHNAPVQKLLDEADRLEKIAQRSGKNSDWERYDAKIVEAEELEADIYDNRERGQMIMPVYLSIQNPLIIDAHGERFVDITDDLNAQIDDAKENGYDGVIINNLDDSATFSNEEATHYVIFETNQVKSINNLNPTEKSGVLNQGKKGFYDPARNFIGLLPTANRSTIIHESAHSFLQYYLKYAPEKLDSIFKWTGIENKKELTQQEFTRLHEAFARGFETYLAEGVAPNKSLQKVFETFREFLLGVYENIDNIMKQGNFKIKLNDDMRKLYSDMLNFDVESVKIVESSPVISDLPALYQRETDRISELRRKRNSVLKKYGKKRKADLSGIDELIKEVEVDIKNEEKQYPDEVKRTKQEMIDAQKESYLSKFKEYIGEGKLYVPKEDRSDYEGLIASVGKKYFTFDKNKGTSIDVGIMEFSNENNLPDDLNAFVDMMTSQEYLSPKQITRVAKDRVSQEYEYLKPMIEAERKTKIEEINKQIEEVTARIREDVKANSITELQKEVIKTIRDMHIDNADKVRFLGMIQRAKTAYSQKNVLMEMYDMEQKYYEKKQRKILDDSIQGLLKKTRPTSKGGIKKGRYSYEDNEFFNEVRRINKLNQEEALKEAEFFASQDNEETALKPNEVFLRQFTSYKAYGKSKGTLSLFEEVHKNLVKFINMAKEAQNEKDFNEKMDLSIEKNEMRDAINSTNFKGDRDSITTKLLNIYRLGFSDFYGLINSIAGKQMADKYAIDIHEKDKEAEMNELRNDYYSDIQQIFRLKNKYEVEKKFTEMNKEEFELFEKDRPKSKKLTRFMLVDIYNSLKNENTKENYYEWYGKEQLDGLISNLTQDEIELADYMQEKVQGMYEIVNAIHIKQYGLDLGTVENYWMRRSEVSAKEPLDEYRQASQIGSYQKSRVSRVIPIPQNAFLAFSEHINNAIHQKHLFDAWYNARKIFDSRRVKTAIEDKYGKNVNSVIRDTIDTVSFNANNQHYDILTKATMKLLSNWTASKIFANVSLVPKQFIGAFNYAESMPIAEFAKYFFQGLSNPKKTANYMFEKSSYLPSRFKQGADDIAQNIMKDGGELAKSRRFNDVMSFFVRVGDAGAVTFGGYAYVKYLQSQGMSEADSIYKFEESTIRTQQAGFKTSLSGLQRNPMMKFFTAFRNAQSQMMRRTVNAMIQFNNGEIDSKQLTKTFVLYTIFQPALFAVVSLAVHQLMSGIDDDDDYLEAMGKGVFNTIFDPIPVVSDLMKTFTDVMTAKIKGEKVPFWVKNVNMPLITDLTKFTYSSSMLFSNLATFNFDDVGFDEIMDVVVPVAEIGKKIPVGNVERQIKGILRIEDKKKTKKTKGKYLV